MKSHSRLSVFLPALLILCVGVIPAECADDTASGVIETDVLVYGGTPAGIAAALTAGREGHAVLLCEPYRHIGGMVTNGLSHTDFRTLEALSGVYLEFAQCVQRHYAETYGPDSPQALGCFHGTHAEPRVNRLVFEALLDEIPSIQVRRQQRLVDVDMESDGPTNSIASVSFMGPDEQQLAVAPKIVIDASYEGDLLAAAGIKYQVGREARSKYEESLAPDAADTQVQGYNFRFIMTRDPGNRMMPVAPPGYQREDFLPLLPLLGGGAFEAVFVRWSGGLFKAHEPVLPNGKYDINDVSRGIVRLSLPDVNDAWPDGDNETRQQIFAAHLRHNVGLLYFVQNDVDVPERLREEARQWGWCEDEFVDTGHLPEQLYVREARRMDGQYIFTQNDTDPAPHDVRSVLRTDAIAMGDYNPNCHGTGHDGPRFGGHHTGEFYHATAPYQIPYGTLVPKSCANLLVPVACSSSHVGFCALRLEPIWTSLGQAAGVAAHLALEHRSAVQDIAVADIQRLLHAAGSATIYVSDVPPGDADFAAVQWWGTQGGLHGLHPPGQKPGQRGPLITSQYYEAFPGHTVEVDRPLDDPTREHWMQLAESLGLKQATLSNCRTRGEFIRVASRMAANDATATD